MNVEASSGNFRERACKAACTPKESGLPRGWTQKRNVLGQLEYFDELTWQTVSTKPLHRPLYEPLDTARAETRVLVLVPANHREDTIEGLIVPVSMLDAGDIDPRGHMAEHSHVEEMEREDTLRTLKWQCDFGKMRGFDALSYCWGDKTVTQEIILNDHRKSITSNLAAALRQFRDEAHGKIVILWADAVCINQEDLAERASQVLLMRRIYHQAQIVHVWLGSSEVVGSGLEALTRFFLNSKQYWPIDVADRPYFTSDGESAQALESFLRLLEVPYWRRKWVVQEVALANRIVLRCGPWRTAPLRTEDIDFACSLAEAALQPLSTVSADQTTRYLSVRNAPDSVLMGRVLFSNLQEGLQAFDEQVEQNLKTIIPSAILRLRTSCCSVPHDAIYAFLSLFPNALGVQPDYTSSLELVFAHATFKLIQLSSSLQILQQAFSKHPDLPSWVPDFSAPFKDHQDKLRSSYLHNSHCSSPLSASLHTPLTLRVKGCIVDEIAAMSGYCASTEMIAKTDRSATLGRAARNLIMWATFCTTHFTQSDLTTKFWPRLVSSFRVEGESQQSIIFSSALPEVFFTSRLNAWVCNTAPLCESDGLYGGTRLFATTSGRWGWVYNNTNVAVGDRILVHASSDRPFCANTCPHPMDGLTTVRLTGTCFVEGVMEGQAVFASARNQGVAVKDVFQEIIIL